MPAPYPCDWVSGRPYTDSRMANKPGEYLTYRQIQSIPGAHLKPGAKPIGQDKLFSVDQVEGLAPKFKERSNQQRVLTDQLLDYYQQYAQEHNLSFDPREYQQIRLENPDAKVRTVLERTLTRALGNNRFARKAAQLILNRFGLEEKYPDMNKTAAETYAKAVGDFCKGFDLQKVTKTDRPLTKEQMQNYEHKPVPKHRLLDAREYTDMIRDDLKRDYLELDIKHADLDYLPDGYVKFNGENMKVAELTRSSKNDVLLNKDVVNSLAKDGFKLVNDKAPYKLEGTLSNGQKATITVEKIDAPLISEGVVDVNGQKVDQKEFLDKLSHSVGNLQQKYGKELVKPDPKSLNDMVSKNAMDRMKGQQAALENQAKSMQAIMSQTAQSAKQIARIVDMEREF